MCPTGDPSGRPSKCFLDRRWRAGDMYDRTLRGLAGLLDRLSLLRVGLFDRSFALFRISQTEGGM